MKKKALVTGGAGFIGSTLTRLLLDRGFDVTVFDNLSFGRKRFIWPGIRFIKGDLRSNTDVRKVLKQPYDQVFHLAAIHFIPYCNAHPDQAVAINIDGTRRLLDFLRTTLPTRLFFASTAAVYDISSRYHRIDEMPGPMDIYGISKLAGEHLVTQFQSDTGIKVAIGRLFNAYGPNETNAHLIPHIIDQLKKGKRTLDLGNLRPFRDYIHTTDMVRAIADLTARSRKGLVKANIASGDEYSVREVVRVFSQVLGKKLSIRSRASLRRKQERAHLRGSLKELRAIARWKKEVFFREGIRELLKVEKIIRS